MFKTIVEKIKEIRKLQKITKDIEFEFGNVPFPSLG